MRDPNHISNNPQGVDSLWESSLSVANRHSKRLAYLSHTHEPAVGDAIQNTNPECDHFESEGVVVSVNEIPSDAGKTVSYECTNTGDTWQTGDVLEKTLDQLSPSSKRGAMHRKAKADLKPVRQRTQFTCMSTSMMMCLNALGIKCDEEEVNKVMGARPMKGAAWEDALACAQHYGIRGTLVVPSTVRQMKKWTDQGFPVMIAWNPEGRPWSHASVVFDIKEAEDGSLTVYVADPNMPNPEKTVRSLSDDEFYGKWYEKWPDYLVRRPALCLSPEITSDGRQVMASQKKALKDYENRRKNFVPTFAYTDAVQVRKGLLKAVENVFQASQQKIAAVAYKELGKVEKAMGAPIENKLGVARAITNYVVEGFENRVSAAPIRTTISASSIDKIVRNMVKWEQVPMRAVIASARMVAARYLGSKQHKSS